MCVKEAQGRMHSYCTRIVQIYCRSGFPLWKCQCVCSAQGFSVWTRKSGPTSECCLFSVTPYLRSKTHVNSNSHIATRRKTKIYFQDGDICLWLFYVVLSLPKGTMAFYTMTLQNNSDAPVSCVLVPPGAGSVFLRDFKNTAPVVRLSFPSSPTVRQVELSLSSFLRL